MLSPPSRELVAPTHGAYGIGISPSALPPKLLVETGGTWSLVQISRLVGFGSYGGDDIENSFDGDRAHFRLGDAGSLVVNRRARRARFSLAAPTPEAALAHPLLGPVGAAFALWAGREAIHAGAFTHAGGAWALLGDREAGKSSTLGALARAGLGIVCDDMLVTDGRTCFAGPRCLDLRPSASARLGIGELLPLPGGRERWRVELDSVPHELPLRGWIFLEWGESVQVTPVVGTERLVRLARQRSMFVRPPRPQALLELSQVPGWRLVRPRGWHSMDAVVEALLGLASG